MRTTRHATLIFVTVVTLTLASYTSVGFATQLYDGSADLTIDITKIPTQDASVFLDITDLNFSSSVTGVPGIGSAIATASAFLNNTAVSPSPGETQLAVGDVIRLFASANGEGTAGLSGTIAESLGFATANLILKNESANIALFSISVDGVALADTSFTPSVTVADESLLFSTVRVRDAAFGSFLGATSFSDSRTKSGVTTQNSSNPIDTDVPPFNSIFTDIAVAPNSTLVFELEALVDGSAQAFPSDEDNPVVIPDPSTVLEPTTVALFGVGLVGLAGRRIRRRQSKMELRLANSAANRIPLWFTVAGFLSAWCRSAHGRVRL